jgi:hypothetical protein
LSAFSFFLTGRAQRSIMFLSWNKKVTMVRNPKKLRDFESRLARNTKPDYEKNLKIYESLLEEARALGAIPGKDPYEGIEVHFRIKRILRRAERIARKNRQKKNSRIRKK